MPVLELTTTGNRSGEPRSILLWYIKDESGPIMAGTNAGAAHDPAWVKNLRQEPNAQVRIDRHTYSVEARFLEGSEHEAAWARLTATNEAYGEYASQLTRPVPLVQLVKTN